MNNNKVLLRKKKNSADFKWELFLRIMSKEVFYNRVVIGHGTIDWLEENSSWLIFASRTASVLRVSFIVSEFMILLGFIEKLEEEQHKFNFLLVNGLPMKENLGKIIAAGEVLKTFGTENNVSFLVRWLPGMLEMRSLNNFNFRKSFYDSKFNFKIGKIKRDLIRKDTGYTKFVNFANLQGTLKVFTAKLPRIAVLLSSSGIYSSALKEFKHNGIFTIGLTDNDAKFLPNYGILGNDDSLTSLVFYLTIFENMLEVYGLKKKNKIH